MEMEREWKFISIRIWKLGFEDYLKGNKRKKGLLNGKNAKEYARKSQKGKTSHILKWCI